MPVNVQRYLYLPAFLKFTVNVVDFPAASVLLFLPLILKSCLTWPEFLIVNVTLPLLTDFLESEYLNSLALTLTFDAARTVAGATRQHAAGQQ